MKRYASVGGFGKKMGGKKKWLLGLVLEAEGIAIRLTRSRRRGDAVAGFQRDPGIGIEQKKSYLRKKKSQPKRVQSRARARSASLLHAR